MTDNRKKKIDQKPSESESDHIKEAALHVSESGVTLYANKHFLKFMARRLLEIAESPEIDHYELHYPDEFYGDVKMFNDPSEANATVVLSEKLSSLFQSVPNMIDVDGEELSPRFGLTIMHHARPLATNK
jgi:hypothetical protein